jgi:ribosomal-protein-alanine N-acetyltransferase
MMVDAGDFPRIARCATNLEKSMMKPELRLSDPSVILREWRRGDEDSLARHANSREVWRNLRDSFPHPYSRKDARRFIHDARGGSPPTHFAIIVDGEAAGGVGLRLGEDVYRRSAEIGFWLGKTFWGRGIMTEVVRAVTRYAFARFDLCRIYAYVFDWNPASARVLEKAGYRREARLEQSVTKEGRTIDQLLYAMIRTRSSGAGRPESGAPEEARS